MDHYSYADQTAPTAALDMLLSHCDCHVQPWCHDEIEPDDPTLCKMCPSTQRFRMSDGLTYCPFQPGAAIEIGPDGKIAYARSPRGSNDYERGFYEKRGSGRQFGESPHWPQLPKDRNPMASDGYAPEAPLPAAFRVVRVGHCEPPAIRFQIPVRNGNGIGVDSTTRPCPGLIPFRVPVQRTDFTEHMSTYRQDMARNLALHEDRLCDEQVGTLKGEQTFVCHYDSTLEDLEVFVRGLNYGRPKGLLLDTVLVNYGMYLVLFGNDPRTQDWAKGYPDYRNMTLQGGINFLHSEAVLAEFGYAMSREQGPVFIHGPTTVSCNESEVEVARHCAVAVPPDTGVPEVPWGVRFNVTMEWKKGKGVDDEGRGT